MATAFDGCDCNFWWGFSRLPFQKTLDIVSKTPC